MAPRSAKVAPGTTKALGDSLVQAPRKASSASVPVAVLLAVARATIVAAQGTEPCADVPSNWLSSSSSACSVYASDNWCTLTGGYGTGWSSDWGTFSSYASDGVSAAEACCACGGGNRSSAWSEWQADSAQLWQTASNPSHQRIAKQPDVKFGGDFDFAGPTISISGQTGHSIVGFGGAFTDAAAEVFSSLDEESQDLIIENYFGATGIGYTLGRVHINSCDFSKESYDFDSVENDLELRFFDDNVTHDTKAMIPLIWKAKYAIGSQGKDFKLLASPWSPPAWMKSNNEMDGSWDTCLRAGMSDTWARYISRWASAYKNKGAPIWAITVQNEPGFGAPWEACKYTHSQEADFLGEHLGPILHKEHPDVKIFVHDHNKDNLYESASTVYAHPTAARYISGLAFHWYTGDRFDIVEKVHKEFPQAILLPSEATYEIKEHPARTTSAFHEHGSWEHGLGYAHDILGDLNAGGVGWIDWNLLLGANGGPNHVENWCDAAVVGEFPGGAVFFHPQFYFIGHFSKFIPPGSVHLRSTVSEDRQPTAKDRSYGICTGDDGLQATSFLREDGQIALVVLNCGDESVDFKLVHGERAAHATIPANAIQTYLVRSSDSSTGTQMKNSSIEAIAQQWALQQSLAREPLEGPAHRRNTRGGGGGALLRTLGLHGSMVHGFPIVAPAAMAGTVLLGVAAIVASLAWAKRRLRDPSMVATEQQLLRDATEEEG